MHADFLNTPAGQTAKTLMDKARRAEDAGKSGSALSGYKRVYKKYPTSIFAPEALCRSGRIYENRRQYTKAFRNLQRVVAEQKAARPGQEVGLTEVIVTLIKEGADFKAAALQDGQRRADCGTPSEYEAAQRLRWN